ncbi:hypothetical protein DIE18_03100 [Burkholderia sp. Bp9125]|nr:hypothetical protein DIE18_03100 [Burkholderia sp. Bp9125]
MLLVHETDEDARASAVELRALGGHARRLLEECVAEQQLTRKQASTAARLLENAGFIFVRDEGDIFEPKFVLTPSLAGEEALEALEKM